MTRYKSEIIRAIREARLPEDWHNEIIGNFSRIALDYSSYVKEAEGRSRVDRAIDDLLAEQIVRRAYREIVDVGVGDGVRLAGIRSRVETRGHRIRAFGTDVSQAMLEQAKNLGITTLKHDMREAEKFPFPPSSLDMILYLSGDFGYIMGREDGIALRSAALESAYKTLRPGGILFMDLLPLDSPQPEDVLVYERTPTGGASNDAMRFYIKMFGFEEMKQLIGASPFDIEKANADFMVFAEPRRDGSFDLSRAGTITRSFPAFRDFDVRLIHSTVENDALRTSYDLLVSLIK